MQTPSTGHMAANGHRQPPNMLVDEKATATGLVGPSNIPAASGNKASYGTGNTSDRLNLGSVINAANSVAYYSMLLQVSDLGNLPTGGAGGVPTQQLVGGFNNLTATSTANVGNLSTAIWVQATTTASNSPFHLGASVSSATTTRVFGTQTYSLNDTLFVVGEYQFGTTTGNYSGGQSYLWVYDLTTGDTVPNITPRPQHGDRTRGWFWYQRHQPSLRSCVLYSTNVLPPPWHQRRERG